MKKTFLVISISLLWFLSAQTAAHCQKVKYTTTTTNFIEVKQSQNGWAKAEPTVLTPAPVKRRPNPQQLGTSMGGLGNPPGLPGVIAPRAPGYLLNNGSSKTRKQVRTPKSLQGSSAQSETVVKNDPNKRVKVVTVTKAPPNRPPATTDQALAELNRARFRRPGQPARSHDQSTKSDSGAGAAPYAASYGDYDPKAKKKRNY